MVCFERTKLLCQAAATQCMQWCVTFHNVPLSVCVSVGRDFVSPHNKLSKPAAEGRERERRKEKRKQDF